MRTLPRLILRKKFLATSIRFLALAKTLGMIPLPICQTLSDPR